MVGAADFERLWGKLTWHRDAPLSEPADIAIHQLATVARGSVKVLLSGEGSDELFGGYPKYAVAAKSALADFLPARPRQALLGLVQRLLPEKAHRLRIALRAMAAASEADRFQTWFAPFTRAERDLLMPGPERGRHREIWSRAKGDLLDRMLYVDCHTWLVDNLLERGDRMAMAASVESRPPFMDHRLVELAMSLRSNLKVRNGRTKWIVKEVARSLLPPGIVDRRKVGFRVPLDQWFRRDLRALAHDLLLAQGSFVSGRMDRSAIAGILRRHEQGQGNEEIRIWTLLCLEVWHQQFFRRARAPDRAASLA
jgi:asparagine synthase (glutamine-hydrolysing)